MAIGTPVSIGTGFLSSASTSVPMTVSGGGAAVGERVIVVCGDDGSANMPSAVVDSRGNTYAADHAGVRLADNYSVRVFSSHITTALINGDTITATVGDGALWDKYIAATKVSGIASAGAVDQTVSATGTSTAWDSGNTATTAQADELIFGVSAAGGAPATSTPGTGLTEIHDAITGSVWVDATTVYKIVSATGAYKADGTWSASDAWAAICVTYKADGAAAAGPPIIPRRAHRGLIMHCNRRV